MCNCIRQVAKDNFSTNVSAPLGCTCYKIVTFSSIIFLLFFFGLCDFPLRESNVYLSQHYTIKDLFLLLCTKSIQVMI
jgi:hypothetical protein